MNTVFIGVDPGLTGAWAAINQNGEFMVMYDMPVVAKQKGAKVQQQIDALTLKRTLDVVRHNDRIVVALERVSSMPGQGVASMFSMGDSFGSIRAAIAICEYSCELVSSVAWKRFMNLDSDKERCRSKAISLFPTAAHLLTRKKDHNRSEALLIAEWLRRHRS